MAEKMGDRAREYGIDPGDVRIVLVEAAATVLPGFDSETIAEATLALKEAGVDIRTKAAVTGIAPGRVSLESGATLLAGACIWTGGVQASQLVLERGFTVAGRGAAVVDYALRSIDHPEVSVIGDSALVRDPRHGGVALPCAQLAVKQGQHAAHDIISELSGAARREYVPRLQGLLISLGGRRGVGTVGPLWVRRLIARLAKIGAETRYLWSIGGLPLVIGKWLRLRAEWVRFVRKFRPARNAIGGLVTGVK